MDRLHIPTNPCGSCPYLKATPAGVWHESEYEKLPAYDAETWEQPQAVFLCHNSDTTRSVCAGWVACGGEDLLALRLAAARGQVDWEQLNFDRDDVWPDHTTASEHGKSEVRSPGPDATRVIDKLMAKRRRRAG